MMQNIQEHLNYFISKYRKKKFSIKHFFQLSFLINTYIQQLQIQRWRSLMQYFSTFIHYKNKQSLQISTHQRLSNYAAILGCRNYDIYFKFYYFIFNNKAFFSQLFYWVSNKNVLERAHDPNHTDLHYFLPQAVKSIKFPQITIAWFFNDIQFNYLCSLIFKLYNNNMNLALKMTTQYNKNLLITYQLQGQTITPHMEQYLYQLYDILDFGIAFSSQQIEPYLKFWLNWHSKILKKRAQWFPKIWTIWSQTTPIRPTIEFCYTFCIFIETPDYLFKFFKFILFFILEQFTVKTIDRNIRKCKPLLSSLQLIS